MDILAIPYAKTTGIARDAGGKLFLSPAQGVGNHLGTVHAGAQYTLAESASADCLLSTFPELAAQVVPVLRSSEVRFRHPASTAVYASPAIEAESRVKFSRQFERKGRGAISVDVLLQDADGNITLQGRFEWYVVVADGAI
ncbi:MAG: DUF4442 domain-containing protein [Pseudomonadota bacterium]